MFICEDSYDNTHETFALNCKEVTVSNQGKHNYSVYPPLQFTVKELARLASEKPVMSATLPLPCLPPQDQGPTSQASKIIDSERTLNQKVQETKPKLFPIAEPQYMPLTGGD